MLQIQFKAEPPSLICDWFFRAPNLNLPNARPLFHKSKANLDRRDYETKRSSRRDIECQSGKHGQLI